MPRKNPPETPLYVRLPTPASEKLDRAASALGVAKKDLVAGLVTRYVDPDSKQGLAALGTAVQRPLIVSDEGPSSTTGAYSFQAYDAPEVLTLEQAAALLQVDATVVRELAEAGTLPGRRLGVAWRFSRAALLDWLASPEGR